MWSSKGLSTGFIILLLMFQGQSSMAASVEVTVNATFIDPSCKVNIPKPSIDLGNLRLGTTKYSEVDIQITCPVNREVGLYARMTTGTILAGTNNKKSAMSYTSGTTVTKAVEFWLTAPDVSDGIDLSGNAANSGTANENLRFCKITNNATTYICKVTPYTNTQLDTTPGDVTASVVFGVVYP